ncbi:MAG: hypothetical protein GXZ04_01635 [Clostridiales bacterium]|nr:hypothetical protein [Clostridiales bacterium]
MKKLYDETHPYSENDHRRTLWFQLEKEDGTDFLFGKMEDYGVSFLVPGDYRHLAHTILAAMKESQQDAAAAQVSETHFVFYTHRRDGDAIGDKVRFTIMTRLKGGEINCELMYSDFLFASGHDELVKVKETILQVLKAEFSA